MDLNEKPRYSHDCLECVFLGQFHHYDLYYCPTKGPTIICRYGSDGPAYESGIDFALNNGAPAQFREAMIRALATDKGLDLFNHVIRCHVQEFPHRVTNLYELMQLAAARRKA